MNDLPQHISNAEVDYFADNTNILVAYNNISTTEEKIKRMMIQLESWFSQNNLLINTDKNKAMLFQLISHIS
jgi:hypothetical protein